MKRYNLLKFWLVFLLFSMIGSLGVYGQSYSGIGITVNGPSAVGDGETSTFTGNGSATVTNNTGSTFTATITVRTYFGDNSDHGSVATESVTVESDQSNQVSTHSYTEVTGDGSGSWGSVTVEVIVSTDIPGGGETAGGVSQTPYRNTKDDAKIKHPGND